MYVDIFLTSIEINPQAYGITVIAFTQKYSVIVFPQGTEVFLLTNLSEDNTRIAGKGREEFLRLRV